MAMDPVCYVELEEEDAAAVGLVSHYQNRVYFFCCEHCKRRFDHAPAIYVRGESDNWDDEPMDLSPQDIELELA